MREKRTRTMTDAMSTAAPRTASSPVRRLGLLGSLAAAACLLLGAIGTASASAAFGISSLAVATANQDGSPDIQAGSHPFAATTEIDFNLNPDGSPDGFVKDLNVNLPPGLVGDPNAVAQCTRAQFEDDSNNCPANSMVGIVTLKLTLFGQSLNLPEAVFNMQPPPGVPAQFGFRALFPPVFINAKVRTGGDYGLTTALHNISHALPLSGNSLTLWGVPADPAHDSARASVGVGPSDLPPAPFLTLPTACNGPLTTTADADSWQNPGAFVSATNTTPIGLQGCDHLQFGPSISVAADPSSADSPAGFAVDLHVPQNNDPTGLATAHLKKAVVTLPEGVSINPSVADGLAGCTPAQIGLGNASEPTCPDASKIGSAEVDSPLSAHPLTGSIFLGSPTDIYVVAEGGGVLLKLHGVQIPNFATGQLTTTFDNNPQLPFTDLKLNFFGGPRAALATPQTCGTFTTTTDLMPWSAPASGPDATPSGAFTIDSGPDGNSFSCVSNLADRPFDPGFLAGMEDDHAATFTPFVLRVKRDDGEQGLRRIDAKLPPGVSAKLAGVPECSNAAASAGTCGASSRVGHVNVGAGAGPLPFYLPGKAYLTGPYKGAPLGLSIVTPVNVGPFNLGNVVVRAAIFVDPTTAALHVVSDPLPTIHTGIPLRLRSVSIQIDRSRFMLSPTNCNPMAVTGQIQGTAGPPAQVSKFFQVAGCRALGFKPKLTAKILGGKKFTGHSKHPGLKVTLKPKGKANVKSVALTLPHSIILDQANINVCTPAQFNANHCPKKSKYGKAKARSPLLDKPLKGPVYLVTNKHHQLPDLVMVLNGQVKLIERGVVKGTTSGRLKTTFNTVPDVPLKNFTLKLKKGKHGLLVNSTNLCSKRAKHKSAKATIKAHNGKKRSFKPKVKTPC
jgi:hypothetical protein